MSETEATKEAPKIRRYVRRTLTPVQKTREMVLTLLGVDKRTIAREIGSSETVIFNLFADKHRSPETEEKIVDFLNERIENESVVGPWERKRLAELGFKVPLGIVFTLDAMGWPSPE